MSAYTIKNAIVDLGFIAGYVYVAHLDFNGLEETLDEAIDGLEDSLVMGKWEVDKPVSQCASRCLHDIGFIRGMLWEEPIPHAVSEALNRLVDFSTGDEGFSSVLTQWRETCEPNEHRLSDNQRDMTTETAIDGEEACSAEFAESIGASHRSVLEYWRHMGAMGADEVEEELLRAATPAMESADLGTLAEVVVKNEAVEISLSAPTAASSPRGTRKWTPEQRAAQAERVRNRPPLVPDSELEAVKAEFEAGTPFDRIGSKFGCSGGHIRNFLIKHGIDPRRGRNRESFADAVKEILLETDAPEETAPVDVEDRTALPDFLPLTPDHWPDIKAMLVDGSTREKIAGDFDVPIAHLNVFIEDCLKAGKERRLAEDSPPGEARAPLLG